MRVIKGDGKSVEIVCDDFANEDLPLSEAKVKCYDEQGYPKCIVFEECWAIYTRRKDASEI